MYNLYIILKLKTLYIIYFLCLKLVCFYNIFGHELEIDIEDMSLIEPK